MKTQLDPQRPQVFQLCDIEYKISFMSIKKQKTLKTLAKNKLLAENYNDF